MQGTRYCARYPRYIKYLHAKYDLMDNFSLLFTCYIVIYFSLKNKYYLFKVLHVIFDLMNEFPVLQRREYILRLNHTSLLTAILLYSAIPASRHEDVLAVLTDSKVILACC